MPLCNRRALEKFAPEVILPLLNAGMTIPYHPPVKRSVQIAGHKTSISLEPIFWDKLRDAAAEHGMPINAVVAQIDAERIKAKTPPGLASAIRVWLVCRRG